MAYVLIKFVFSDTEAVIEHYRWTEAPENMIALLETYLLPFGASPSDPFPEMTVANEIVRKIGGEIIAFEPPKYPDDGKERIY